MSAPPPNTPPPNVPPPSIPPSLNAPPFVPPPSFSGPASFNPQPGFNGPPPVVRQGVPVPVVVIGLVVVLILGFLGYMFTRPSAPAAQPSASAAGTGAAPVATPSNADGNESDQNGEINAPTPSLAPKGIAEPQARAFLEQYFSTATQNPQQAYRLLTPARQGQENYDGFVAFWQTVDSVSVTLIRVEGYLAICSLTYLLKSGKQDSQTDVRLWLWQADGELRLDLPGPGSSPEQTAAREELQSLRQSDLQQLRLDGSWAVVLSTKRAGIKDDAQVAANGSHYFYETDILALHRQLVTQFGNEMPVLMLLGTDFGKQTQYPPFFWRTVGQGGFSSKEAATAWCQSHFSGSPDQVENSCLATEMVTPYRG